MYIFKGTNIDDDAEFDSNGSDEKYGINGIQIKGYKKENGVMSQSGTNNDAKIEMDG